MLSAANSSSLMLSCSGSCQRLDHQELDLPAIDHEQLELGLGSAVIASASVA